MVQHVVVVGAGVYGAAVSAGLTRRGARVTVVDAGRPAGGTSAATFSWTNSCGKQPAVYHELNVAGMAAHRRLAADAPHNDWYHESGNLEWAADDAGRAALRVKVAGLQDRGYEARWLDRAEALRLEPAFDPAGLPEDGIAHFPREGWVDPPRLVGHLLARAGADLVAGDGVAAVETDGGVVRGVRLASGRRIAAGAVVNCAGPGAGRVAALAGLDLPMRNRRGVLVVTSPVPAPVGLVVHAPRVHARPEGGGRVLLHSEDSLAADGVLAAGRALCPGLRDATVDGVRVGERPIPGDGLPVLGRVAALPGFFFAVSHSGVTLSVHAGDLVAAEVLGEDRSDALAAFRFERF